MPPRSLRASLRAFWHRVLREHASPGRLAAAVAVGVLVGCSPFFGLHLWIGLGLAWALRLNRVAVFLGSQISIPPIAPFLGFASVEIGSRLLEGRWIGLAPADFSLGRLPTMFRVFLLDWIVGGVIVGATLAVPVWVGTFLAVRSRLRAAEKPGDVSERAWRETIRRATSLYVGARRSHRVYLQFKARLDPVYGLICAGVGRVGVVVDLGTGLALLPALLSIRHQASAIHAVEWDDAKLSGARQACSGLVDVTLHRADAREFPIPPSDVICLVDVLHYYPVSEQSALLGRAAAALNPGGRLVIRETVRSGGSFSTRALERFAVWTRWNRGPEITDLLKNTLPISAPSVWSALP